MRHLFVYPLIDIANEKNFPKYHLANYLFHFESNKNSGKNLNLTLFYCK